MRTEDKVQNKSYIEYTLNYTNPVELTAFTKALTSFNTEYRKYISENYNGEHPYDAKLYIEKIKEGSIVAKIVEYSKIAIPFLTEANTILEFGTYLKTTYSFFKGDSVEKPKYDLVDLENLQSILAPSTDTNCSTNIEIKGDGNNVMVLQIDSAQANEMTNRIINAKKELKIPSENIHYKQAFYWNQVSKPIESNTGKTGIIEAITVNKLKVEFDNDDIRNKMIFGNENPLKTFYIVDVEVHNVRGEPKMYKILNLHEIVNDEEN